MSAAWANGKFGSKTSGDRKNGLMIGFGTIAEGHAEGYRETPSLEIVGVVDPSLSRQRAASRYFPTATLFSSVEHALASLDDLDFVDICSPPTAHLAGLISCLQANLFVICEKPLVCSRREADLLIAHLELSSGALYPAHNYAFAPAMQQLIEISSGSTGDLLSARFDIQRVGHARGVAEWIPDWRRMPTISGGGILLDHGPHSIYLALRLAGHLPDSVECVLARPAAGRFSDTEDQAHLNLWFGSARFEINLSWRSDHRSTSYLLRGTECEVLLNGDILEVRSEGTSDRRRIRSDFDDPRHGRWFRDLLHDAYCVMDNPEQPSRLVKEAFNTMAVLDAAYRSAAQDGQRLNVEQLGIDR
jgi:predicted dehydrogenase